MSEFLEKCCGKAPTKSAAADLDVHSMATRLVEEYGSMATLHALLKSDEALAKGDRAGQKTWLQIRETLFRWLNPEDVPQVRKQSKKAKIKIKPFECDPSEPSAAWLGCSASLQTADPS